MLNGREMKSDMINGKLTRNVKKGEMLCIDGKEYQALKYRADNNAPFFNGEPAGIGSKEELWQRVNEDAEKSGIDTTYQEN